MKKVVSLFLSSTLLGVSLSAFADEIERFPVKDFPIAEAVVVPGDHTTYYFSGTVPSADENKQYGNTEAQTRSVLKSIEKNLEARGLTAGDVVKMQVFLVGDPAAEGKMDFAGFMKAYTEFFGTEAQPNLPVRSVFQVAGLAVPEWLVEIEVIAVKK
ncbi:RidA family protein [Paenalcaligenes niemegkensis]|uniref:RidA family protein n=1 Tax=Paenalcaligenes niemegkensis TaxID=2895469 RepID=UPI001EE8FEBB|nr:RidA family protein [Paenalcaligenes niemegkensis]MCQ9616319.1 RidA family protein [Paenalcaligenes niemegkensis]